MLRILIGVVPFLLGAFPLYGQWERVVVAWTGESDPWRPVTQGSPHPLQYYVTPSPERDPINSLCLGCPITTVDGPKRTLRDYVVDVSQRPLGESFKRKIVEIVLSFRDSPKVKRMYVEQAARENRVLNIDPDTPEETPTFQWTSVVMERSPGAYQELYLLIDVGVFVPNLSYASVSRIEGVQILGIAEHLQGNGGICGERYWVLDRDGPWLTRK